MRAVALLMLLVASPALGQTPAKPAIAKPRAVAPAAPAAVNPEVLRLRAELKQVNASIATHKAAQKERDRLKDKKDSISEMGQQDMLMLQQLMDKKNELEAMISSVMRAGEEGGQAVVQAAKDS
jgi:hypothetical protein